MTERKSMNPLLLFPLHIQIRLREIIRYFLSALMGVSVDWIAFFSVLSLLRYLFHMTEFDSVLIAQIIARTLGAIMAFYMFKNYAFRHQVNDIPRHMKKFIVIAILSWLISVALVNGLNYILMTIFHSENPIITAIAKISSDGISFVMNYFFMKFYVFHNESLKE